MNYLLTDGQWTLIAPLLPSRRGRDNRHFVEAVLWLLRNGCRWRALPAAWGNWHTMYTRFQRWARTGVWDNVFTAVQQDEALHTLLVDSTSIRVHQHGSGARKKTVPIAWGAAVAG